MIRVTKTRISVVVMVVMAVLSFFYLESLGLRTTALEDNRTALIQVDDTNGVIVGARVLLRGVPIGYVKNISPSADGVTVEWEYSDEYQIPVDSVFRIDNLSALGEPYVSVLPAATDGPYLADNAVVNAEQIEEPTSFQELSRRLTLLLGQIEPAKVRDVFESLDIALPDEHDVLGNLNYAGEVLASEATAQRGSFGRLLAALQPVLMRSAPVATALGQSAPDLVANGAGLAGTADAYHGAVLRAELPQGMVDATPLLIELQKFLDVNASDLEVIGTNLLPGVQAAAASMRAVPVPQLLRTAMNASGVEDGAIAIRLAKPPN
ncbi:MlaD family protein [Gordonia sp. KTR9]|uniref:MlaD family protein n=1 Tax=Gordonia sp. KTR9 TaxID=337191 RepID=UPI00027DDBC1|nr:MlaD family protein [Gordonia sp. KTR9]AFR48180.1 ABC-type transport system involved in resistance to organic solvents, periplasmic component [Gordonia sp. KTR9]